MEKFSEKDKSLFDSSCCNLLSITEYEFRIYGMNKFFRNIKTSVNLIEIAKKFNPKEFTPFNGEYFTDIDVSVKNFQQNVSFKLEHNKSVLINFSVE